MAQPPFQNQALLTLDELLPRLDEFHRSIEQFNDGYYFESHETLEDLWMVTPWPERQFFQAIIQIAAAFVHFVRGEYPGIIKLLDGALEKLPSFAPQCFGVDVSAVIASVDRARDEIATLGTERFRTWDEGRRPRITFVRTD